MRDGNSTSSLKNVLSQRISHLNEALTKLGEFASDPNLTDAERKILIEVGTAIGREMAPLESMLSDLSSVSTRCAYCGENIAYDGKKYTCANCGKSYVISIWKEKASK